MHENRNHLASEKSPYLLQHKDNPVWWWAWGDEPFEVARRRGVPVFVSIGYSTCHWCHVMERDSFEDEEVARYLNEHFVSIKVDREERPDIDAIYMDAVQAMSGHGGWPMTVFLTPDRQPFFGGTFFPRDRFLHLLERITDLWTNQREQVLEQGRILAAALARHAAAERAGELDEGLLLRFLDSWRSSFDPVYGGRRGRPKFPQAGDLRLLLRIHRRSGDETALKIVTKTLDAMARGGICDQLGGGFHRYSTDERWIVPHFEKMLYDQAALSRLYVEAFQVTGDPEFAAVAREIADYVLRDMTHPDGGFYSAEDADSEGEEGKFYVWTLEELQRLLSEDELDAVRSAYGVTSHGNFERGTNILVLQPGHHRTARPPELESARRKLLAARARRVRPQRDDKILTDWNGLMIGALAEVGRVLGEPRYVEEARRAALFVLARLRTQDGRLLHRWRDGEAAVRGFLEDYAYMIDALIELYESDFDGRWLDEALRLQDLQDRLFFDSERGDYFATDGSDPTVLVRRVEAFDNVRPAGRSVAAMNLLRLSELLLREELARRAAQVFASTPKTIRRVPVAFADLLAALDHAYDRSKEVAIVGSPADTRTQGFLEALHAAYLPNVTVAAGPPDTKGIPLLAGKEMIGGEPTAYVCEQGVCKLPTTDPQRALELARTFRKLATAGAR
ncbi:MAG: thioredoxin domain-containing protein [Acidobacteria bacterium]|nr:MAG: thioredoxin domain-containing protein [Acidobacteriota bacterium]